MNVSKDIREELFGTIRDLREKRIDPKIANAVALCAEKIMDTVYMEIQLVRLKMEMKDSFPGVALLPTSIEVETP